MTDRPVFHLLFKRWIKKIAAYTFLCSVNKTRLRNKEHRLGVCMFSVMYHVLPRRTPLQHGAARVTSLRVPQVFIPASPSLINDALPSRSRSLLPITFETVSTPLLVYCWQSLWHICRVVWREYRLDRNKPLCRSVSPSLSLALHSRECVCVSYLWGLTIRIQTMLCVGYWMAALDPLGLFKTRLSLVPENVLSCPLLYPLSFSFSSRVTKPRCTHIKQPPHHHPPVGAQS